ncbi:hypothetical protein [Sphingobacterium kitahiroshimense]|uniref:Uncharacterized protein n=1 Tax=Sphingobacterium kitahiroshimense TaxID=470446 RepID=A0ABV0BY59_9SPHI
MTTEIPLQHISSLLIDQLRNAHYVAHYDQQFGPFNIKVLGLPQHLILTIDLPNGNIIVSILNHLTIEEMRALTLKMQSSGVTISYETSYGQSQIKINYLEDQGLFHYQQFLTPAHPLFLSEERPECFVIKKDFTIFKQGNIFVEQAQLRSGICYFDFGKLIAGSLFYFQNFSTLYSYAEDSQISYADSVKISWPEFGFKLPTSKENPLEKGKKYQIRDSYIIYSPTKPKNTHEIAATFLSNLSTLYRAIPKPNCSSHNLIEIREKCLHDLCHHKGCWQQVNTDAFLNAYLNDYENPAESMVQLAILYPLIAHRKDHKNQDLEMIISSLKNGISRFFDPSLKCIVRWIPEDAPKLDQSEEQKKPRVMDSWYLHHPLLNLAFIIEAGGADDQLKQQFISSLHYCIQVAQHFKYQWPIFYDLDTMVILKKEAAPGEGGEKDVAGLYAFLLLKAYKITKKPLYLQEAKKAANTLKKQGFNLLYQANNTAYAAEALLDLWSISGKNLYLRLFEVCVANLMKNTAIWNLNYGNAKEYNTFFMLFPLKDAPYAAVFEEQECALSFNRIVQFLYQQQVPISKDIILLLSEYIKYALNRLPYYYPPMLPKDILSQEVKTGFLNVETWIPIEDLGDGWTAPGAVGQEVYGAGGIFNAVNGYCIPLKEPDNFIQISYPNTVLTRTEKEVILQVLGTEDCDCTVILIGAKTTAYKFLMVGKKEIILNKTKSSVKIPGNTKLTIKWT